MVKYQLVPFLTKFYNSGHSGLLKQGYRSSRIGSSGGGVRRGVGLDEGHELSPTMSTLNEGQKRGRVRERGAGGKGEHTSSSS